MSEQNSYNIIINNNNNSMCVMIKVLFSLALWAYRATVLLNSKDNIYFTALRIISAMSWASPWVFGMASVAPSSEHALAASDWLSCGESIRL